MITKIKHLEETESKEPLSTFSFQLSAKAVNFYYGDFHALKNINMEIEANTVTAFIGPSGCGKSTFLRLFNRMNDLIDNTRLTGECLIDNENIYNKSVDVDDLRKKVGMVFQKPNPFPKSIFENVAYGLRVNKWKIESGKRKVDNEKRGTFNFQLSAFNSLIESGKRKVENEKRGTFNFQLSAFNSFVEQRVEESLKAAALWDEVKDKLKKSAFELSGGQQQRLCIARALAVSPSILLMDEPASALDPISTSKIEELIHSLKKDYTIVIVTHNMQQAARVSDKTGFFMLGELIEYDDTKKIFLKPANEQTQNYITGRFG